MEARSILEQINQFSKPNCSYDQLTTNPALLFLSKFILRLVFIICLGRKDFITLKFKPICSSFTSLYLKQRIRNSTSFY